MTIEAGNLGGLATNAKQDDLRILIETLQELIQRLAPLGSTIAEIGGKAIRAQVINSITVGSAPSTAVTGPITSALSIAEKAIGGIGFTTRVAIENTAAIQSNINNIIAS